MVYEKKVGEILSNTKKAKTFSSYVKVRKYDRRKHDRIKTWQNQNDKLDKKESYVAS